MTDFCIQENLAIYFQASPPIICELPDIRDQRSREGASGLSPPASRDLFREYQ
jgi:hypothetical protein